MTWPGRDGHSWVCSPVTGPPFSLQRSRHRCNVNGLVPTRQVTGFFRGLPPRLLGGSSQKKISEPTRFISMLLPDAFTAEPSRRRTVATVSSTEGVSRLGLMLGIAWFGLRGRRSGVR